MTLFDNLVALPVAAKLLFLLLLLGFLLDVLSEDQDKGDGHGGRA